MSHLFRVLLTSNVEGGGGGSSSGPDLTKVVEGLISKYGDPNSALRVLLNDNHEQRDQIRDLKGKVPAEGSVVLTGDDAKDWASYRDLGKPSDLRKVVSERDQLKTTVETFHRAEAYDAAAATAGINPKAFRRLAEAEKLDLETKDILADDGKKVPTVHVKGVDDKGAEKLTPLSEYIDRSWAEFKPALYGEGQKVEPSRPSGMPTRRDPNPAPPPNPNGGDLTQPRRSVGLTVKPM